ncbi:NAD(P)/FAD-dependent oxidoreductase [Martelella soudanensis]|uniref:NAD(P)/FAD-dependent oxidoreductase n=1 Tax=unclassified Martelella TaxID=2629616 RepID=UPI0015E00375|nr:MULTISPECIES: FAD-dependent oxidoreductase [unclassified Martelella]
MSEIIVLGAGMVGVATALSLQARGHDCVIVDRSPPGRETSYGNAGIIQAEAVEPYSLPANPLLLLAMALGRKNAVRVDWLTLPAQVPALLSYWRSSMPGSLRKIIPVWRGLIEEAIPRHAALIEAAGAGNLVRENGYWEAYETEAGLAAGVLAAERRRAIYGLEFTTADRDALQREEPALKRSLAGAINWSAAWSCADPGELVGSYAALFEKRGGRIISGDAASLERSGHRWSVAGETAAAVVVSLGPWSPQLVSRFGYHVPMVRKRGYHRHYRSDETLSRPMMLSDHSVVMSPMLKGLRIASAAELSSAAPSDDPRQLLRGEAVVRTLLDIGEPVEAKPWSGTRPCLPGMLPLVCKAPRHEGLWFHFGHGHQGFTLGPVTAERLARAFDGDGSAIKGLDAALLR